MTDEANARMSRLSYEAQVLQAQEQRVREQFASLNENLMQLRAAIESIKALTSSGTGYIAVGAGAMAPASFTGGSILVGVGAGVLVEKSNADAVKMLEERAKEIEEAGVKLQENASKLHGRMHAIEEEARAITGD